VVRQDEEIILDVAGVTVYAVVTSGTGTAWLLEVA
jgi:hypothetical protein